MADQNGSQLITTLAVAQTLGSEITAAGTYILSVDVNGSGLDAGEDVAVHATKKINGQTAQIVPDTLRTSVGELQVGILQSVAECGTHASSAVQWWIEQQGGTKRTFHYEIRHVGT